MSSDSFVKNQKTRLIPKGNRSPPLMRLSKYPTFEELGHWRKMHENTFFNRNRIVKGITLRFSPVFITFITIR